MWKDFKSHMWSNHLGWNKMLIGEKKLYLLRNMEVEENNERQGLSSSGWTETSENLCSSLKVTDEEKLINKSSLSIKTLDTNTHFHLMMKLSTFPPWTHHLSELQLIGCSALQSFFIVPINDRRTERVRGFQIGHTSFWNVNWIVYKIIWHQHGVETHANNHSAVFVGMLRSSFSGAGASTPTTPLLDSALPSFLKGKP